MSRYVGENVAYSEKSAGNNASCLYYRIGDVHKFGCSADSCPNDDKHDICKFGIWSGTDNAIGCSKKRRSQSDGESFDKRIIKWQCNGFKSAADTFDWIEGSNQKQLCSARQRNGSPSGE